MSWEQCPTLCIPDHARFCAMQHVGAERVEAFSTASTLASAAGAPVRRERSEHPSRTSAASIVRRRALPGLCRSDFAEGRFADGTTQGNTDGVKLALNPSRPSLNGDKLTDRLFAVFTNFCSHKNPLSAPGARTFIAVLLRRRLTRGSVGIFSDSDTLWRIRRHKVVLRSARRAL